LLFPFARPDLDTNGHTRAEYLARQGGVQAAIHQACSRSNVPIIPEIESFEDWDRHRAAMGHLGHRAAV